MSERQLPWHVRTPRDRGAEGFTGHTIWDDAGQLVAECFGENSGREEGVAICSVVNRNGDMICSNCGEPATCFGSYETELRPAFACDECCAHGNEDGHCERVEIGENGPP